MDFTRDFTVIHATRLLLIGGAKIARGSLLKRGLRVLRKPFHLKLSDPVQLEYDIVRNFEHSDDAIYLDGSQNESLKLLPTVTLQSGALEVWCWEV